MEQNHKLIVSQNYQDFVAMLDKAALDGWQLHSWYPYVVPGSISGTAYYSALLTRPLKLSDMLP